MADTLLKDVKHEKKCIQKVTNDLFYTLVAKNKHNKYELLS